MHTSRYSIFLFVVSLLAAGLVLFSTQTFGVGLSPDSIEYIASARNIAHGLGVTGLQGSPVLVQPPLYPLLLAGVQIVSGIDPAISANLVNTVFFGMIVFLTGLLIRKYVRSMTVAVLGTLLTACFSPLVLISQMAWTEPLFVVSSLAFFYFVAEYLAAPRFWRLCILSLMVGLACLTRYIGVTLAATGGIVLLGFQLQRRESLKTTASVGVLFVLVGLGPLIVWLFRNWDLSGTLFGPHAPSMFTLRAELSATFSTFRSWFPSGSLWIAAVLYMAALAILLGIVQKRDLRVPFLTLLPLEVFWLIYVVFLIITSTTTAFDRIDTRLLSPVAVPTLLILLGFGSSAVELPGKRRPYARLFSVLFVGGLVALWAWHLHTTFDLIQTARQSGIGYSSERWSQDSLVRYLQGHRVTEHCAVYSNDVSAVYYHLGIIPRMMPLKTYYNSPAPASDPALLQGQWPPDDCAFLVWFRDNRSQYYTLNELRAFTTLDAVVTFGDEGLYTISKRSASRTPAVVGNSE